MGTIRYQDTIVPLTARFSVGRSSTNTFCDAHEHVSSHHALISWDGLRWIVRDLGSKNGTFVDGVRLAPGEERPVTVGTTVAWGNPTHTYEVFDASPPGLVAAEVVTGRLYAAPTDVLVLPDGDRPEISIYQDEHGVWMAERADGETTSIQDETVLSLSQESWRVFLPKIADGTPVLQSFLRWSEVSFKLEITRDDAHVRLTITHSSGAISLEPRRHLYLLAVLAQARRQDEHLPPQERGWRTNEQLTESLAMAAVHLNVAVHRVRRQVANAGLHGAARVIEVRRGQKRLGTDRFSIVTVDTL